MTVYSAANFRAARGSRVSKPSARSRSISASGRSATWPKPPPPPTNISTMSPLARSTAALLRQLLDRAVGAVDAAVAALAGLAAQQALGREAEAVGVDRELHVVLQDLAAADEARAAAPRAQAERVGRQLVADDAEEVVVDVERFDRRVGAVAERRVDARRSRRRPSRRRSRRRRFPDRRCSPSRRGGRGRTPSCSRSRWRSPCRAAPAPSPSSPR